MINKALISGQRHYFGLWRRLPYSHGRQPLLRHHASSRFLYGFGWFILIGGDIDGLAFNARAARS